MADCELQIWYFACILKKVFFSKGARTTVCFIVFTVITMIVCCVRWCGVVNEGGMVEGVVLVLLLLLVMLMVMVVVCVCVCARAHVCVCVCLCVCVVCVCMCSCMYA